MFKLLNLLGLTTLLCVATCFAQVTGVDHEPPIPPEPPFAERLSEISSAVGIGLPAEPVEGRDRDIAYVVLCHENGRSTGVQFTRLGRTERFLSRVEGPFAFTNRRLSARGLDVEDRRHVWKVLEALPNSLDEAVPTDRRLLIVGVRDGHQFGSILDRSKLDETIVGMLRRLPPVRGLGYCVPLVKPHVQPVGERSVRPSVAAAPQFDGFVYSTRKRFQRGRWPDPTSPEWSDVTIWEASQYDSIRDCDVSPDGKRWLILVLNSGSYYIHVGHRQELDAFKFQTVVKVAAATSCRFAANSSHAVVIHRDFHGEKRSFHRLPENGEAPPSAEVLPTSLFNLSNDGRFGVCHEDGDVVLKDLQQQLPPRVIERDVREIMSAEFSPDHKRLLLSIQKKGGSDHDSSLWKSAIYDLGNLGQSIELREYGVAQVRLLESVWSADSGHIFGRHVFDAVLSSQGVIHVWDAADGRHVADLSGCGGTSSLHEHRCGLSLCDAERRLVAATPCGEVRTWDLQSVLPNVTKGDGPPRPSK